MHLHWIELQNLGPFRDPVRLHLKPLQASHPIILIGGRNGSGKSTVLNGIRLCLWGRSAQDKHSDETAYETFILNTIHCLPSGKRAERAQVTLAFDLTRGGITRHFELTRRWLIENQTVNEQLNLLIDGNEVPQRNRGELQQRISELFPPGLHDVFLFDGEQLQRLVEDDRTQYQQAIEHVLGVNLIDAVRERLYRYIQYEANATSAPLAQHLEGLLDTRAKLVRQERSVADRVAAARRRFRATKNALKQAEQRYCALGGSLEEQDIPATLIDQWKTEQELLGKELRKLAEHELPLALVSELAIEAAALLEVGHPTPEWHPATAKKLLDVLGDEGFWPPDGFHHVRLSAQQRLLSELAHLMVEEEQTIDFSHWSPGDRARASRMLRDSSAMHQKAEQVFREWNEVQEHLSRAASRRRRSVRAAEVKAQWDTVQRARQHHEVARQTLFDMEEEETALRAEDRRLKRQLGRTQVKIIQSDQKTNRLALAACALDSFAEFRPAFLRQRLHRLEDAVTVNIIALFSKTNALGRVSIQADTFMPILYSPSGQMMDPHQFSMGERHLLALAQYWGLALASGHTLPIIMDTPLSRLDQAHRKAVVSHLPKVARQVILFSTDSEIEGPLQTLLSRRTSHTLTLNYLEEEQRSVALQGYFPQKATITQGSQS